MVLITKVVPCVCVRLNLANQVVVPHVVKAVKAAADTAAAAVVDTAAVAAVRVVAVTAVVADATN
jgi:hypothetical protein